MSRQRSEKRDDSSVKLDSQRRRLLLGGSAYALSHLVPRWSFAQTASTAFDYYISPTGSDSNPGTLQSPWAISALSTKSQVAGKHIGLLDGIYVSINSNYESAGIRVQSGFAGSPTIVEAVNPRQAIITGRSGSSYPGQQGLIGVIGGSYVTFRNLTVTDGVFKGFAIFGSNNIRIESCHVYDFRIAKNPGYAAQYPGDNVEGIRIEGSTDVTVNNCKIHDCYNANTNNHNGSGTKHYSSNRTIIEYTEIYGCCAGIYDKNGNNNTTVRYCYIHDLGTDTGELLCGFDMPTSSGTHTLHNNVLVGNGALATANDYSIGHNLIQYNNTTVLTGPATTVWDNRTDGQSVGYYNNIIQRNGNSAGYGDVYMNSAVANIFNYNCYDAAAIAIRVGSSTYSTLASWRSASGKDAQSFQANPSFTGTGTGAERYKLSASSPCRGAGRVGGVSSGAVTDIGAWQSNVVQIGCDFSGAGPTTPMPPSSVTAT